VSHIGPVLAGQPLTERDDGLGSAAIPEGHGGRTGDVAVIRRQPLRDERHGIVRAEAEEAGERLRENAELVVAPQREEAQEERDVGTAAGHVRGCLPLGRPARDRPASRRRW
jgi:hypothetical protein